MERTLAALLIFIAVMVLGVGALAGRPTPSRPRWKPHWVVLSSIGFLAITLSVGVLFLYIPISVQWLFLGAAIAAVVGVVLLLGRKRRGWLLFLPLAAAVTGGAAVTALFVYGVEYMDFGA